MFGGQNVDDVPKAPTTDDSLVQVLANQTLGLRTLGHASQMPAIVLTFDEHQFFARHMLESYRRAWPSNPFFFLVPYTARFPTDLVRDFGSQVRPIQTPPAINETMLVLLKACNCQGSMIFFAIDDYFPVEAQDVTKLGAALDFVRSREADPKFAGMVLAYTDFKRNGIDHSQELSDQFVFRTGDTNLALGFLRKQPQSNAFMWCHGFWREGIIRAIYSTGITVHRAKDYDNIVSRYFRLFFQAGKWDVFRVAERIVSFQEATHGGKVDRGAAALFRRLHIEVPLQFLPPSRGEIRKY